MIFLLKIKDIYYFLFPLCEISPAHLKSQTCSSVLFKIKKVYFYFYLFCFTVSVYNMKMSKHEYVFSVRTTVA